MENQINFKGKIAEGTFGTVWLVEDTNKNLFVAKEISKSNFEYKKNLNQIRDGVWKEILMMKKAAKINYNMKLFLDLIENDKSYFIMQNYLPGLNLLSYAQKKNLCNILLSKKIILQLLHVTKLFHDNQFIHNDLKLENVIIDTSTEQIKVVDYGLSYMVAKDGLSTNEDGSGVYFAPEKIIAIQQNNNGVNPKLKYNAFENDFFGIGVIFFALIVNMFPWNHIKRKTSLIEKKFCNPADFGTTIIDSDCKSCIADMLRFIPLQRLSFNQLIEHPCFQNVTL